MFVTAGIFMVVTTVLSFTKAIEKTNIPKQKGGFSPIKVRVPTEKIKKGGFQGVGNRDYAKRAEEEFNNFSERILGTT